jgi:hypothetical protein
VIAFGHNRSFAQVALLFGCFVGKHMVTESTVTFQITAAGLFEPLRNRLVGVHFRHV